MEDNYKVIFTGRLQPGANKDQVIESLCSLFKKTKEQSEIFVSGGQQRVIKKNITQNVALKYKNKLSEAGLEVEIKRQKTEQKKSVITDKKELNNTIQTDTKIVAKNNVIRDTTQETYTPPTINIKKEKTDQMGFFGLFGRFTLCYILTMVIISIILSYFGWKGNSGSGFAIIYISVMLACTSFTKKNDRVITQKERIKATLGFSFINIFFQLLFSAIILIGLSKQISITAFLIILAIPVILHTPLIYFVIGSNTKRMIKRGEV